MWEYIQQFLDDQSPRWNFWLKPDREPFQAIPEHPATQQLRHTFKREKQQTKPPAFLIQVL